MKRYTVWLMACALMLPVFVAIFPARASAAGVAVTMSAEPSSATLSQGDLVNITVWIKPEYGSATPESGLGITLVSVSCEGRTKDLSSFAFAGEDKAVLLEDVYIDSSRIGQSITVALTYVDVDRSMRVANCQFTIASATPSASFSRSASSTAGVPGDVITVQYSVRNRSDVEFTDLVITDDFLGEVARFDSLPGGESAEKAVEYTLAHDVVSRPTLSYTYQGASQRQEKTLSALSIYVDGAVLALELSADAETLDPGDVVTLTLRAANTTGSTLGEVRFDGCPWLELPVIEALAPGETRVITKSVRLWSDQDIALTGYATDPDGVTHTCLCRPMQLRVAGESPSNAVQSFADTSALTLSASADDSDGDGEYLLSISVYNAVGTLSDVEIYDKLYGVIEKINTLPMGESLFTSQHRFEGDTLLNLTLHGKTPQNAQVLAYADELSISFTPAPSDGAELFAAAEPFNVLDYPVPLRRRHNAWIFMVLFFIGTGASVCVLLLLLGRIRALIRRYRKISATGGKRNE